MQSQTIPRNHKIPHQTASLFRYIILLVLLLGFIQPIHAQNEIKAIYVYIDTVSDLTNEKAQNFLVELQGKLQDAKISVEFMTALPSVFGNNLSPIAEIFFAPTFNGERIIIDYSITITPTANTLVKTSPILKNGLPISVMISEQTAIDLVYGTILFTADRCDLAIPIFEKLTVSKEIAYRLNYNLATCYLIEGDYKKSLDLYDNQLFTNEGAFLGTNLAWLYLQTDQEVKAFETMDIAINDYKYLDGNRSELFSDRAQLYNLAFRYDDAITDLTAAIELSPTNPELYTLRGQTYLLLYEWDAVLADYNKALELDPTYADAYYYRGVLYYSILQTGQEMYTAALADFQRYLELAPEGIHAAEATRYATDIQTQINALNN